MLRSLMLAMSRSDRMERWLVNSRITRSAVRRFVAGSTVGEAIGAAQTLIERGVLVTMDLLGEAVQDNASADRALAGYMELLDKMAAHGIAGSVSIKPTQLGLALNQELCRQRLHRLVASAESHGQIVEIDMEDSRLAQSTLDIYLDVLREHPLTRIALQAYLHRTADDFKTLTDRGGRVRLVKGAYREPETVAITSKRGVDASFLACTDLGLAKETVAKGFHLALGTHDEAIIEQALVWVRERGLKPTQFEFQFLYGIRADLQKTLNEAGWAVRVYVPFGESWYPYFMRRLAERPANLAFVLKQYFKG